MVRAFRATIAVLLEFTGIVAFAAADPAGAAFEGDIAFRKSDFDSAKSCYRLALSDDPKCAHALWGLGRIEELNFRRVAARDYFAAAFRLPPRHPQTIR